MKRSAMDA